jgi:hypothetical protein
MEGSMLKVIDILVCFVATYLFLLAIVLAVCGTLGFELSTVSMLICVCLAGLFSVMFGTHIFD